jgi:hypothetical protein
LRRAAGAEAEREQRSDGRNDVLHVLK